jgi:hypothetical protein
MFKKFVKFISVAIIAVSAVVLTGCGERVEVPPANLGKIMTNNGYQKETIPTSKIRLDPCFSVCDKLVTLDQSDKTVIEKVTIFMPTDKLQLVVPVQTTLAINPTKVDSLFNTLPPSDDGDGNNQTATIKWATIYSTYAQSIIAAETTSFISKYSISELSSNLEQINADLRKHLTDVIAKRTPFNARYVGISQIQYPDIITKAQEGAAQRREQIQTEEAQLEISKVKLERELQEARLTRQIELEKSQTTAAANRVQAETITSAVLEKQRLDNQAAWIEKWNGILPGNVTADVFTGFNRSPK